MKYFIILALLLSQCTGTSNQIHPTSINVEDLNEQVLELEGLPFNVTVSSDWNLKTDSFAHELWKTSELQMLFQQESTVLSIPDGAEVIRSVDNLAITSFCILENCVIQMNGHDLIEAHVYTFEGMSALEHLR